MDKNRGSPKILDRTVWEDLPPIKVVEGAVKGKPNCPILVIPEEAEEATQRPRRNSIIVNLLGRRIGYKILEQKMWVERKSNRILIRRIIMSI